MPIYEYFCTPCAASFELLRPAREAHFAQPCPACDESAGRQFSAFSPRTFRDGTWRQLPDRGKFWHLEREVGAPIREAVVPGDHPDLPVERTHAVRPPSTEELEAFEHQVAEDAIRSTEAAAAGQITVPDPQDALAKHAFRKRVADTTGERRRASRRPPNEETAPRTRA